MSLSEIIRNAIKEDIGSGDHTSLACIPENKTGRVKLIVKEDAVLAGVEIAKKVFREIDKNIKIKVFFNDGDLVKKGDVAFIAEGKIRSLLSAERLVLNFMQRMSGIATATRRITSLIKVYDAKILDTRKTTPNFRVVEKEAVRIGGGQNHRFGLYDMIMIKDNHVDFAGGIRQAIESVHGYLRKHKKNLKVEIEARNLDEVREIIAAGGVHRIMLDNFSVSDTKKAVKLINKKYETEVSGNITIDNVTDYAKCGVDYISVGSLTHHIKSIDMSLKAF